MVATCMETGTPFRNTTTVESGPSAAATAGPASVMRFTVRPLTTTKRSPTCKPERSAWEPGKKPSISSPPAGCSTTRTPNDRGGGLGAREPFGSPVPAVSGSVKTEPPRLGRSIPELIPSPLIPDGLTPAEFGAPKLGVPKLGFAKLALPGVLRLDEGLADRGVVAGVLGAVLGGVLVVGGVRRCWIRSRNRPKMPCPSATVGGPVQAVAKVTAATTAAKPRRRLCSATTENDKIVDMIKSHVNWRRRVSSARSFLGRHHTKTIVGQAGA